MYYLTLYLVFAAGVIIGASCISIVSYRKHKEEDEVDSQ